MTNTTKQTVSLIQLFTGTFHATIDDDFITTTEDDFITLMHKVHWRFCVNMMYELTLIFDTSAQQ